jgi:hypothetical protein
MSSGYANEPQPKKKCSTLGEPPGLSLLYPHRDLLYYLMGFLDHKDKKQFSLVNKHMLGVFRQKHKNKLRLVLPTEKLQKLASKDLLAFPAVCVKKLERLTHWTILQKKHLVQALPVVVDIRLHSEFDKSVPMSAVLYEGLTHLEVDNGHNQPFGTLPTSFVSLKPGYSFDQALGPLPSGLEQLVFGPCFNHPIEHWPESLRCLRIGAPYQRDTDIFPLPAFPLALTYLEVYTRRPLPALPPALVELRGLRSENAVTEFPATLRRLKLHTWNAQQFCVPSNVTRFSTGTHFSKRLLFAIGSELTRLSFDYYTNVPDLQLPLKLTVLDMHKSNQTHPLGALPDTLEQLILSKHYCLPIEPLPPRLWSLELGHMFSHPIRHFPSRLRILHMDGDYTVQHGPLPDSLKELYLTGKFKVPIGVLPDALTTLHVGDFYNFPLGRLPGQLAHLRLGTRFNKPLGPFPPTLETLELCRVFKQPLHPLPASVKKLAILNDGHCLTFFSSH